MKERMREEIGVHNPMDWSPLPDDKVHSAAIMEIPNKIQICMGMERILF